VISAKVTRKDRLYAKLKQLAPEAAKVIGEEALKAANEMAATARNYAPVDDGDLRDSIVVTPGGQMTPAYSQPGGSQMVPENAALVTAGNSKVRYPHLVEYGTRPHVNQGKFPGTHHPGTRPQPFFWPSFRLLRRRFRARMTRAINKAIKKAAVK
jgi:HK97 gp10 family phage protein